MAVGTSSGRHVHLDAREVETVPADATALRHVDQLDDQAFDQFLGLVEGDTVNVQSTEEAPFEDGEVIVHTAYFRVTMR
jgi:propanediol utilization protein